MFDFKVIILSLVAGRIIYSYAYKKESDKEFVWVDYITFTVIAYFVIMLIFHFLISNETYTND